MGFLSPGEVGGGLNLCVSRLPCVFMFQDRIPVNSFHMTVMVWDGHVA